jgi:hypothetical protein
MSSFFKEFNPTKQTTLPQISSIKKATQTSGFLEIG